MLRSLAPLLLLSVLCALACSQDGGDAQADAGSSDATTIGDDADATAPVDAGTDDDTPPVVVAEPDAAEADAPTAEPVDTPDDVADATTDTGDAPSIEPEPAGPRATLVPWAVGEQVEVVTLLALTLEAEVDMGLFSPTSTYSSKEHETLRMAVLEAEAGERRQLDFRESRRISVLPIVGRKEDPHRVHGKAYVVHDTGDGAPVVTRPDSGKVAGEKASRTVLRSWSSWVGDPPLHGLLASHDGPLLPGVELVADDDVARRLLGLPVEELQIDGLTFTVESTDGGVLVGHIHASLGGSTELGQGHVALRGHLQGELRASMATGRMTDLELNGRVTIEADGEGLIEQGDGPLKLRRRVRKL